MIFNKNLTLLKRNYPFCYKRIVSYVPDACFQPEPARTGMPTLKYINGEQVIYLHSKYDPIKEAQRFTESIDFSEGPVIVYGFGLGYHLKEMLPRLKSQMYVFEFNLDVFYWAMRTVDLTDIIANPLVKLAFALEDGSSLKTFRDLLEIENVKLVIHSPSKEIIPKDYSEFKLLLSQYKLAEGSIKKYMHVLEDNFASNVSRQVPFADELLPQFAGENVFLVSAGPSLDMNGHLLRTVGEKGKIVSVGTALKPLLAKGVIPDLVVVSDPSPAVAGQFEGISYAGKWIILSTAYKGLLDMLQGTKYIALQKGFEPAEKLGRDKGAELFNTGGSVATLALDFALKSKPRKIVLVGQDLAFTNGRFHAQGTFHKEKHRPVTEGLQVPGYNGGTVETSLSLYSYLKWIERRILPESVEIVNATEGGAFISGTVNRKLEDVLRDIDK